LHIAFHKKKNRQNLKSLREKVAAVAAVFGGQIRFIPELSFSNSG